MEDACRAKFSQYPELKELLLATHPFKLVQLKPGDGYWGTGKDSKGKNALGVILEKIREEMLEELRNWLFNTSSSDDIQYKLQESVYFQLFYFWSCW